MDVGRIVAEYLEAHGYDGLWNPDGECACLTNDIGACEQIYHECQAGWMAPCTCGEHDFHITTEKPKEVKP
jgi:hypothetical protein